MNLVKQEKNTKEFPTSQLIVSMFGIAAGSAIGDPTGISAAAVPVIIKWGLDRFIKPLVMSESEFLKDYFNGQNKRQKVSLKD